MYTPFRPGPRIATTAITSTMNGKAMKASITRTVTASTHPRK